MSYARKAAHATIIVFTVSILAAFIGYLIRIILARNLTPSEYGLFFSVFTLITLMGSFRSFGLEQALIKYIPEFQVKEKLEKIKNSIWIVMGFYIFSTLFLAILLIIFSKFLAVHYFKEPSATQVIFLLTILFVLGPFKQILRTLFNAFQKMVLFSLMYLTENTLILVFTMIFFYLNLKIYSPILAYLAAYVLQILIFFPFFLKVYPVFRYRFKFSSSLTKKLLKFGIPVMLSGIGAMILTYTDTLILTYFSTLEEVGIYNVVVPTAMLLNFFGSSISLVIFPMISEVWAKNLKKQMIFGIALLQKYSFMIIMPFAIFIFSFPKLLLELFFGDAYVSGALTLQLLVIGIAFFSISGINMTVLSGIGKPKITTKIMLVGALFNLATNFYFIPKYGMLGAGMTSLASYLLMLILSMFCLKKIIKVDPPWSSWVKTAIASLIFVLVINLLRSVLYIHEYLEAVICLFAAGVVYLVLIWLLRVISIKELQNILIKRN